MAVMPNPRGERVPQFSNVSVSLISVLVTAVIFLTVALSTASRATSYDKDQAFIKATLTSNTQNIHDLTLAVQQLTVEEATLQVQLSRSATASKP